MTISRREQLRRALEDLHLLKAACPEAPLTEFDATLQRWLEQRCLYRERYRGGVVSLHLDYLLWCGQELEVPCSLDRFQDWLVLQGFQLDRFGLVRGLLLKVDLWEKFSQTPWKRNVPN
jgi:hypothetical protein